MAFFTSLTYYRPGRPPKITAAGLSNFLRRILRTELVQDNILTGFQIKFGRSIRQDLRPSNWLRSLGRGISVSESIEWDITSRQNIGLSGMVDELANNHRQIYRAFVSIGMPADSIRLPITREPSAENSDGYYPDNVSLEIGPIELCSLTSDYTWNAGWVALCISGYGYLYPWTLSSVIQQIQLTPGPVDLCEICRSSWPVASVRPGWLETRRRRRHISLWPYEDIAKTRDWFWGVQEG